MIITIDLEMMPPSTRGKIERILKQLERAGKQANRVAPGAYSIITQVNDRKVLGIKRIQEWALTMVKPTHMESFIRSIGTSVCNLLFYTKCDICPAKKYRKDKDTCTSILGMYSLTEFDKGERL